MNGEVTAKDKNILLVGGGKMGEAILSGCLKKGFGANKFAVIEPNEEIRSRIGQQYKVLTSANSDIQFEPDIILFAIKPQNMAEVLPRYKNIKYKDTLFISIAAGITIEYLEKYLGEEKTIVRAMPNLPALIGKSATWMASNKTHDEVKSARDIFNSVGIVAGVDGEVYLDFVTALSGSGPGYVFYLLDKLNPERSDLEQVLTILSKYLTLEELHKKINESKGPVKIILYFLECLANAETTNLIVPLPEGTSERLLLACDTLTGSIEMFLQSKKPASELAKDVASKGGTTEAAYEVFNFQDRFKNLLKTLNISENLSVEANGNFKNLIGQALTAAAKRSKQLSQ